MIPKVIHYCWFGGNPLPELARKCIASWRKYLPDYEIKEWNESNFDVNIIPYTAEAYKMKKYAFVSDYARFCILYKYGGLYFDTDVEVIRPMGDIVNAGPFMGCEKTADEGATPALVGVAPGLGLGVNPGLGLGVNPGLGLYQKILEKYAGLHFIGSDGRLNQKTVVKYTTELLVEYGLKNSPEIQEIEGVKIYPKEYFCPKDYLTGKLIITQNTYTIHHYAESWHGSKEKLYKTVKNIFGYRTAQTILAIYQKCRDLIRHAD